MNPNGHEPSKSKRSSILIKVTLFFVLLGVAAGFYWFYFLRWNASTDDAYVEGNIVRVTSPQSGIVIGLFADDMDFVEQGQLLIQLDTTPFELAFDRAKVNLALAAKQIQLLQEEISQRQSNIDIQKANLEKIKESYQRRLSIQNSAAISQETLSQLKYDEQAAEAALNQADFQLDSSLASLGTTALENHPTIESAKINLRDAYINLQRCFILAPITGFVAQRFVQLGEWVTPDRPLMSVIPLQHIWVTANFKETELRDIRLGQPVSITSDLYGPDIVFHGKVDGINAGTGSIFSLLPPQNASGNWIKIIQRVPVRVNLNPDEVKQNPLLLGLSMYAEVDIATEGGPLLKAPSAPKMQMATPVYTIPMEPVEDLIQAIIKENLSQPF